MAANTYHGSKVRVIGTDQWMTISVYYDSRGRIIQTVAGNHVGGQDVVTNLYSFDGKVLSSYQSHTNPKSTATPQTKLLTMQKFDAAGRLISVVKRINDNSAGDVTIQW